MIGPELQAHYPPDWAGGVEFRAGDVHRSDDGREYMFVRFDDGSNVAAVVGNICVFKNANPDRQMGSDPGNRDSQGKAVLEARSDEHPTVTSDYSDGVLAAGMFVSAPDDGNFCWIQTKGYAELNQAAENSPANGDGLTLGSTDGKLALWDNSGTGDKPMVATMIDNSTANNAKQKVDLRC